MDDAELVAQEQLLQELDAWLQEFFEMDSTSNAVTQAAIRLHMMSGIEVPTVLVDDILDAVVEIRRVLKETQKEVRLVRDTLDPAGEHPFTWMDHDYDAEWDV